VDFESKASHCLSLLSKKLVVLVEESYKYEKGASMSMSFEPGARIRLLMSLDIVLSGLMIVRMLKKEVCQDDITPMSERGMGTCKCCPCYGWKQ
jgi:hypothetical protein